MKAGAGFVWCPGHCAPPVGTWAMLAKWRKESSVLPPDGETEAQLVQRTHGSTTKAGGPAGTRTGLQTRLSPVWHRTRFRVPQSPTRAGSQRQGRPRPASFALSSFIFISSYVSGIYEAPQDCWGYGSDPNQQSVGFMEPGLGREGADNKQD